ncbi:hypothetical protein [Canibacter oris]|uniref:Antimicrobial peptide system SdpB family protein n=1 Tax=Canibacter oris TaxID=1365628 RepID=A0A840DE72_9MICO|nr:hypothetical protein [Canibacter oris]MBB4071354.1 antimicrobial peptide system SdpB family protein [Canibacter oris]
MQNNLEGARIILLIITVPAIFGLLPAVSSLLHLYAAFSVSNNTLGIEGGDQLIVNLITLLAISSICDYRLTTWLTIKQNIPRLRYIPINILYCFIYIQVSYVYFEAAIAKAVNPIWGDGTALWYWVQNDGFGISADAERLFLNILSMPIVSAITTWGTILLELLFSFSILAAKNQLLRYTMVACAINFHFIIAIIMGLTTFFISMTGALLLVASTPLYLKIKNPLQEETHLV